MARPTALGEVVPSPNEARSLAFARDDTGASLGMTHGFGIDSRPRIGNLARDCYFFSIERDSWRKALRV